MRSSQKKWYPSLYRKNPKAITFQSSTNFKTAKYEKVRSCTWIPYEKSTEGTSYKVEEIIKQEKWIKPIMRREK